MTVLKQASSSLELPHVLSSVQAHIMPLLPSMFYILLDCFIYVYTFIEQSEVTIDSLSPSRSLWPLSLHLLSLCLCQSEKWHMCSCLSFLVQSCQISGFGARSSCIENHFSWLKDWLLVSIVCGCIVTDRSMLPLDHLFPLLEVELCITDSSASIFRI
jgi:hypothetical protein